MTQTDSDTWPSWVPACPDWSPRDLLSHLVGFASDVTGGDEPDDHNEQWTARQVSSRQDRSVSELVGEWRALTASMQEWLRTNSNRPINDITIHEQDLRGALGVTGGQDTPAAHFVRDCFVARFADAVTELPVIELRGEAWRWQSRDEGRPTVVVAASDADLARAVISRRSEAQLRRWTLIGDIGPFLEHFAVLGLLPGHDLSETFGPA